MKIDFSIIMYQTPSVIHLSFITKLSQAERINKRVCVCVQQITPHYGKIIMSLRRDTEQR